MCGCYSGGGEEFPSARGRGVGICRGGADVSFNYDWNLHERIINVVFIYITNSSTKQFCSKPESFKGEMKS